MRTQGPIAKANSRIDSDYELYLFCRPLIAVFDSSRDVMDEHGVRVGGARFELGVEVTGQEPRVILDFQYFYK